MIARILCIYLLVGFFVTFFLAVKGLVRPKEIGFSFIAYPVVLIDLIFKR